MTYLTVVQDVAYLVGVQPPSGIGDPAPVAKRFRRFADRAGQEIARRADWNKMMVSHSYAGDGGTSYFSLPEDFDRLPQGNPVWAAGEFIRGAVSYDEWVGMQMLPGATSGQPRIFNIVRNNLHFFPPPPAASTIYLSYISKNWIVGSTTENFTTNEQTTHFPERLLVLNMVWRWRRAQGAPFDDELKEFEAMLAEAAASDAGLRPPAAQAA